MHSSTHAGYVPALVQSGQGQCTVYRVQSCAEMCSRMAAGFWKPDAFGGGRAASCEYATAGVFGSVR